MIRIFLFSSFCFLVNPAFADLSVPERAITDQVWGQTYRGLVQNLGASWKDGIREELAEQSGLDLVDIGKLLRFLRSYPADDLQVKWVLVRYPHYNAEAVTGDFQRLEELGLLQPISDTTWKITVLGDEVVRAWYELAAKRAKEHEAATDDITKDILIVLHKIVATAAAEETDDLNESVHYRLNHNYRVPDDAPLLLKIDERVWDYIAYINDLSHYRVAQYRRESGKNISPNMTPLAKELFGATRSGREYPLSRCAEQPNWRVGETACVNAFNELIDLGWVSTDGDGIYRQTKSGDELFKSIEVVSDRRRYATWQNVTQDEYTRYKEILDTLTVE